MNLYNILSTIKKSEKRNCRHSHYVVWVERPFSDSTLAMSLVIAYNTGGYDLISRNIIRPLTLKYFEMN